MNLFERAMVDLLRDMRDQHAVIGVRGEFEAEGAKLEEMLRLKEISVRAGLGLTIKVGGCEAVRDLSECRLIGAERVLAPMIESPFALRKYLAAIAQAYPESERHDLPFSINIETGQGYEHREEICRVARGTPVRGIVMGRVDMAASIGLGRDGVESETLAGMARELAACTRRHGLEFCVGGAITHDSLDLFRSFAPGELARYETRKVVFDATRALATAPEQGLGKAVEFELLWLKARRELHLRTATEQDTRIELLERRLHGMNS